MIPKSETPGCRGGTPPKSAAANVAMFQSALATLAARIHFVIFTMLGEMHIDLSLEKSDRLADVLDTIHPVLDGDPGGKTHGI